MSRAMVFRAGAYSGFDLLLHLLPTKMQAKIIAKRLLKTNWKGANPIETDLIIEMPGGSFKVLALGPWIGVVSCEKRSPV